MGSKKKKKINTNKKNSINKSIVLDKDNDSLKNAVSEDIIIKRKKFCLFFILWICIFGACLLKKTLQNDTFYTIKIGELIINNGIDMMDHFSFHSGLAYTYPHWLYDVFIYLIYSLFGYVGIHISSVILYLLLIVLVFKVCNSITSNYTVSAFATFICTLALSSFATARAQLVSFLVFALQIYFIESFLKSKKKKYLFGLLLLSLILCNIHVAVWPFYFILFLPYLAEYVISFVVNKIKIKKDNWFITFLKKKFIVERNKNIKWLFIIMLVSLVTGLFTPIGDTPYTYLIKTMIGNSQDYIMEHQMISWANSPFTIIIAVETLVLALISKIKLRDLFMLCGLVLMSIVSTRHLSLLALVGSICYARLFSTFLENYGFCIDDKIIAFFHKKSVAFISFLVVIIFSGFMFYNQLNKDFIDKDLYPVEAVKYIKENFDVNEIRIFNEYNFGSYLILNDIPVFIDSRADLYTKQFSGFDYDIFDDFYYLLYNYEKTFEFYDITHILMYKKEDSQFYNMINTNRGYKVLYEDEHFAFFERLDNSTDIVISYN